MAEASKLQLEAGGTVYDVKDKISRDILTNPYVKNGLARGKNIQTYFDNGTLFERIADGSLDDLFIGDHWKAPYNGVITKFRIAGFNMFMGNGGSPGLKQPHAVIVPESPLISAAYMVKGVNDTTGGYQNSYMNTTWIGAVATEPGDNINGGLYRIFGSHLLTTREMLTNSINPNMASGNGTGSTGASNGCGPWTSCQAVLMSEIELYGANVFSSSGFDTGCANTQLPLFRLMPNLRNIAGKTFWLRNVASSTSFCCYANTGIPYFDKASTSHGVRPRFVIG